MDKCLGSIIVLALEYLTSIKFTDGANQVDGRGRSRTDTCNYKLFIIRTTPQTPRTCGASSENHNGFPCLYGCTLICEKHVYGNLYRFINKLPLTAAWNNISNIDTFPILSEAYFEKIRLEAKFSAVNRTNFQIPKSLPPPGGRPCRHAGKMKEFFFERGFSTKPMGSYSWPSFHQDNHTEPNCPLHHFSLRLSP